MRRGLTVAALCLAAALPTEAAERFLDAPEAHYPTQPYPEARSYGEALRVWRGAGDVNAWIGARFEYDRDRAILLSETQRTQSVRVAIHAPEAFFSEPSGVCVDLARFAVETLRAIDPETRPQYVMIEFEPVSVGGNVLRRHWLASFEHEGQRWFFADSWRPGHIAGPYADTQGFMEQYARERKRAVVAFRELESYERKARTLATKQSR